MGTLALRFISGKYKGKEHILADGKETVLGRSADADVVLMEDMVSRRHTLMMVNGDEIVVTDNGSTNGTFVNGEKVTTAKAVKGDRILIGTSIMKIVDATDATRAVEALHPTIEVATASKSVPNAGLPRPPGLANQSRTTMHSGARSMSGTIAEVPLPDLIQLFSTSKKTGTLVLTRHHTVAKIHLDSGCIIHASLSDAPGMEPLKAMFRILSWDDGDFELLGPEPYSFTDRIEMPTEHILMEGLRQLDEMRRFSRDLPSPDTELSMMSPLDAPLSTLKPHELDILQLLLNRRTLSLKHLIDASPCSDREVIEIVQKLIKAGYITVKDGL